MKSWGRTTGKALIVAAVVLFPNLGTSPAQDTETSPTQARMRGVFITLTTAYKLSLDSAAYEDPNNRMQIMSSLQALVANSSELERHGAELDRSFDHLKRSLARDAMEALQRFQQGEYVGSRWMLNKITENCVTCHSKLPAGDAADITGDFMRGANMRALDPFARAELLIATRQFDRALETYEGVFSDLDADPRMILITGVPENYLRLCLVVRRDTERPTRELSKLAARKDTPNDLRTLIRGWLRSLGRVNLDIEPGAELEVSRELIERARAALRFPADRSRQVEFIEAVVLLHRYLSAGEVGDAEAATALYLLGVAESYVSRSYWISETEHLLEAAIRTAPTSPVARDAYSFLEEYLVSGRTSKARELPEDIDERLKELRVLIGVEEPEGEGG